LADRIHGSLVQERDGSEKLHLLDSSVDISGGFDDHHSFHSGLTGDLGVDGEDFFDESGSFDFAYGSDGGFDFTDDTAEHATDDTAEHATDDSAFDSALDAAFDADIGEFFFGDFFRDFDGGDEFTGFDGGLRLDRSDAGSSFRRCLFFSGGWRRWRRWRRRSEEFNLNFYLMQVLSAEKREDDHGCDENSMKD
jgi:hypothetical protein